MNHAEGSQPDDCWFSSRLVRANIDGRSVNAPARGGHVPQPSGECIDRGSGRRSSMHDGASGESAPQSRPESTRRGRYMPCFDSEATIRRFRLKFTESGERVWWSPKFRTTDVHVRCTEPPPVSERTWKSVLLRNLSTPGSALGTPSDACYVYVAAETPVGENVILAQC